MSDTDVDYGPEDPSDLILRDQRQTTSTVMASLDDDPQKASRAIELGQATGDHPALIYSNLENYENQHKAALTSQLLNSSKFLRQYIDADPMHAKISNDDYSNLDAVSSVLSKFSSTRAGQILRAPEAIGGGIFEGAMEGFKKGWENVTNPSHIKDEEIKDYPLFTSLLQSARFPIDVGGALISAGAEAVKGGSKAGYQTFTGDEMGAERFSREMAGMAETVLTNTSGYHGIKAPTPAQLEKVHGILDRAKPWLDDGKEPPRGLDPEIDKLKFEQNKLDLDNLDEAFKASQASATRERNPDIFASFVRQHTDAKIGISGDAVAKLYGDKLPEAGDNILGFVPGLAEELETAKATGGDVHIPLADWLAKADPEVAKALHDDIRVRPGGITKVEKDVEAEAKKGIEVYHGSRHDFDQFDISKVGEGQGAQSYGHGLYLAENEKVAESYRLTGSRDSSSVQTKGNIYKARFNAEPHEIIDFDTPLSEQPDNVIQALAQATIKITGGDIASQVRLFKEINTPAGEWLLNAGLKHAENAGLWLNPAKAATALREVGIKGIKYRDKLSRGKEAGTHNYIAFDDKDLQITHKNAVPLPEPLPSLRASSALEPLFSIGDRKLELKRMKAVKESKFGAEQGFHDFDLLNEKGDPVGTINLSEQNGGKELYIDMINGINGYGARDFGPALMRDLFRQLREEFPNAETLGGHRVSGVRDRFNTYNEPHAMWKLPMAKLDVGDIEAARAFKDVLSQWKPVAQGLEAKMRPTELYGKYSQRLIETTNDELNRIAPTAIPRPAEGLRKEGDNRNIRGAYIQYKNSSPQILYSLASGDSVGIARHEAIHHLRREGFFKEGEWDTLSRAARDEGWIEKFEIDKRYPDLENAEKLEEAIADGYRAWAKNPKDVAEKLHPIFEKIKQFVDALKAKFKEIIGHEPAWEELFGKVESGEVGSREGNIPLDPNAYREALNVEGERPEFDRAAAIGMTVDQYKRYMNLIEKRHTEDLASSMARAEKQQAKRLTKEWKENEKEIRGQVEESINARPDVAADRFFSSGELFGDKLKSKPELNEADLTPEQIAKLPPEYVGESGLNPDDAAGIFGYSSASAMIDKLAEMNEAKTQLGLNSKDFLKRITDQEIERQMQAKYGALDKSILEEAKDQAISETQLDLLHEEVYALALKAGGEFSITKGDLKSWIKTQADRTPIGSLDTDKFLASAGKSGKAAEMALLKGDFAEAFREKQRQYLAMQMANEAKKLEKQVDQFDKQAKRLSSRDQPSMEPTYVPFIHQILMQVGKPIRRSVQDLQSALGNVGKSLEEFVDEKQQHSLREVPVAAFLYDPTFQKKFEDLTAEEFRAVHDSIKALSKNARDELKIYKAGEEADLADIKTQMVEQLRTFKEQHYDASGGRWLLGVVPPKVAKVIRTYGAAHLQLESLFNRWDRGDPRGVFSQYVMRDLATSANYESALEKKYSRLLKEVDDGAKISQSVDNPIFYNPLSKTGGDAGYLMQFTRKNLRAILLNAGNESNLAKLAKGYDLRPEQVRQWLDQHATKEDWAWAQKMGDVFAEIKKEADTMYSSLTGGVEPEAIDIKPIQTPHGEQKGWYYPIIYHPEFEGTSKKLMGGNALEEPGFRRASTPAGYTKARTAYSAPMSLELDMLPVRMRQMLHDIAMRPAVINASKIFYDKDVRAAIQKHYGTEYRELLVPYLRDVANSANFRDDVSRVGTNVSEFIRQNVVSTLIGLNPGTVMKHGPTAAINSLTEVGIKNFAKAVSGLMSINEKTGESNWKFAMDTSEELQRRHRNYSETLSGATQSLIPTSTYQSMRESIIKFSSTPVAISDLLSAVPTWLAKYETAMSDHGIHGDAIAEADKAVRRAHGSVAITNRSGVMRTGPLGSWFASVYGFFNHIMNRQYELMWRAGDALGMVKQGDFAGAMKETPRLTAMLFSYVLLPALIEEMVTPLASDDKESWGKKAAKGLGYTLSASWIGIRDIASGMLRGQDPAIGLFSTTGKMFTDMARDLNKDRPFSKEHAGKIIQHGATVIGGMTGLANAQLGKAGRFGYDVSTGKERPKGPWSWMVGARFGTTEKHSKTFDEWLKHH